MGGRVGERAGAVLHEYAHGSIRDLGGLPLGSHRPALNPGPLRHNNHTPAVGGRAGVLRYRARLKRSAEPTSELQSLMRISYAVFCLKKHNVRNILSPHHKHT